MLAFELGKRELDRVARRETVIQSTHTDEKNEGIERTEEEEQVDVEKDRAELTEAITKAENKSRREAQNNRSVSFGPAFGFGIGQDEGGDK